MNIMKTNEYKTSIFYRIACACSDPSCDATMVLEYDKEINDITLSFYKDLKYCSWWGYGSGIFWRILKSINDKILSFLEFKENWACEWFSDVLYDFHTRIWDYWKRINGCFRLIFTGKIKLEEHLLINNIEHINSFIDALNEGAIKLEGYKFNLKDTYEKSN